MTLYYYPKDFFKYWYSWNKRVCLWNTYWGLEPAQSIPPNYIVTGPLQSNPKGLMNKFEEKDSKLKAWMDKALEEN